MCFARFAFALWAGVWAASLAPAAENIPLWPEGVPGSRADAGPEREEDGRFFNVHHPALTVYPPATDRARGTAVILAPGGGYQRLAVGANGGEITRWLTSLGVTVFVLKYRNAEYGAPAPLQDALRAVRMVRARAAEFGVRPDAIGMLGGSAGAHVAACAGTMFDAPEGSTGAALDRVSGRPDFMILIFPVLTMQDPYAHAPSRRHLLGDNPNEDAKRRWSAEEQVNGETPPAFLVHSAEDRAAVVENSLLFYQAMRRAGAPIEMHLYPRGPHGSGLDPRHGTVAEWPKLCAAWLRVNGWLRE